MVIVPIPVEAKLQVSENQTMKYMDVATASEKWGITGRRIRILCNDGRIDGAVRNGWTWQIPEDTPKPGDGRVLRKFRNLDIRTGFVDVAALEKASLALPVESSSTSFFSSKTPPSRRRLSSAAICLFRRAFFGKVPPKSKKVQTFLPAVAFSPRPL